MVSVLTVVGLGLVGTAAGVGIILGLYNAELLSWSATTAVAPLIVAGLGILGVIGALGVAIASRSSRAKNGVLAGFVGVWLGISGGAVAPGLAGEVGVWAAEPESVVYQLDVTDSPVPTEILDAVGNPLEGERATLNYMAALPDGSSLMVSSAGTGIFGYFEETGQASTDAQAVLSHWPVSGEPPRVVSLTEVAPEVQLVRGIHFDSASSVLYLSNAPVDPGCGGLELWSIDLDVDQLSLTDPELIFSTTPCLEAVSGYERFGGRIVTDDEGTVYLSVGDFGNGVSTVREELADGPYLARPELMSPPATFGAVIAVEADGSYEVVSRGHRNPQGLHFDSETQSLWLSEHGPKGGDEVNLIQPGNDYGWPDVTYGGPYGGQAQPDSSWSIDRWYGTNHGDFTEPVFTWIPAIAASQLAVYHGEQFPAWTGDLLVASFKGNIHRLRLVDQRVVFDEVIAIGTRPRDMIIMADGSLRITTDDDRIMMISGVDGQ